MEIEEILKNIKVPVTVIHVIAVVFGMGGALVSDILFSFFSKDKKLNRTEISTLSLLSNAVFYSLILIIVSGITIFLSDIDRYSNSDKFLAKISILVVLLVNGYILNKIVWPHILTNKFFILQKEKSVRKLAFACGAISVISWISVCALGVLDKLDIRYSIIMFTYLLITGAGILVALLVEKRELN